METVAVPRSRERTRERLIEAAYEVFAEQGISAPSVEVIAERAGFTRGAFYSNFDSKTELFFAICDAQFTTMLDRVASGFDALLNAAVARDDESESGMVGGLVEGVLGLLVGNPHWVLFDAEFETLALRDPGIAARSAQYRERMLTAFTELLTPALERVGMRFTVPPLQATRLIKQVYVSSLREAGIDALAAGRGLDSTPPSVLANVAAIARTLTERF